METIFKYFTLFVFAMLTVIGFVAMPESGSNNYITMVMVSKLMAIVCGYISYILLIIWKNDFGFDFNETV